MMQKETLKNLINKYMYKVTCVLVIFILLIFIAVQILTEQKRVYRDAERTIRQIASVIDENQKELLEVEAEYHETCINNAEIVARIIELDLDVLDDIEKLKEIAEEVGIDEIHVFDTSGKIFAGTHPEYYGYTFDSGEQMMFFKPMLTDKTLKLVQDITPNTAEEKPMQYSAVWSESGELIVQIGMEPVNVMKATEKNELSYIFSLFRVNMDANYYAIDCVTEEIIASTDSIVTGKKVASLGIDINKMKTDKDGFHATINGKPSFCVFEKIGENYIGRVVGTDSLYQTIPMITSWGLLSLLIVAFVLAQVVLRYMNYHVVTQIEDVNKKLKSVADGNLDETFDMNSSKEFLELSNYINLMIKSLLNSNKKLAYALEKTNIPIGTYEYGGQMSSVRYTEYIPKIFSLEEEKMQWYVKHPTEFALFLDTVMVDSAVNEKGVYCYDEKYIRIEEILNGTEVFGVVIDITEEITKRKQIEKERDIDILTGLYNRRGLDHELEQLFTNPSELGVAAIFMIDADGLKGINDTFGHEKGDIYIKKIGQVLAEAGEKGCIAARQGGDEFVLFLYGYDSEEELLAVVKHLEDVQSNSFVALSSEINVPLRFSMGYSMVEENVDYPVLIKHADEKMYQNKLDRREGMQKK